MLAQPIRLRSLVHGVLLCSPLTTWLGKPVDVVASYRTHTFYGSDVPQPVPLLSHPVLSKYPPAEPGALV